MKKIRHKSYKVVLIKWLQQWLHNQISLRNPYPFAKNYTHYQYNIYPILRAYSNPIPSLYHRLIVYIGRGKLRVGLEFYRVIRVSYKRVALNQYKNTKQMINCCRFTYFVKEFHRSSFYNLKLLLFTIL